VRDISRRRRPGMAENGYAFAAFGEDLMVSKAAASSSRKSSGAAGRWIRHQSWTMRICSRASGENSILEELTDLISPGVLPARLRPGSPCRPRKPSANVPVPRAAAHDHPCQGRPLHPRASDQRPCLLANPPARGALGARSSRLLAVRVSWRKDTTGFQSAFTPPPPPTPPPPSRSPAGSHPTAGRSSRPRCPVRAVRPTRASTPRHLRSPRGRARLAVHGHWAP